MLYNIKPFFKLNRTNIIFLLFIYIIGLYFRLIPRLQIDPHLLTFNADIWYRLAIAQFFLDHWHLPEFSLRYLAYGNIPTWYNPISPIFFAILSKLFQLDLPTISSRVIPFIESLTPISFFFLARYLYNKNIAYLSTIILALTPSFVYWSGISDPQSFILFMLPIIMLLWIHYTKNALSPRYLVRVSYLLLLGGLLGICFLTHLMYFLMVIILYMVTIALILEKKATLSKFLDLTVAVLFSQILTIFWWGPKNLYWWWINGLTTSSTVDFPLRQLKDFGIVTGLLGISALIFLILLNIRRKLAPKHSKLILIPIFWVLIPFLETQLETFLYLIQKYHLAWNTLIRPLEGFRFYCFLAQPFALASGYFLYNLFNLLKEKVKLTYIRKFLIILLTLILLSLFFWDIQNNFNIGNRLKIHGFSLKEYKAALWYRNNSKPTDRIIADYYTAQMIAGVAGGKALLGAMFPLRNVDMPYITVSEVNKLNNDIKRIYSSPYPRQIYNIARKYNCTHIFYSDWVVKYGYFRNPEKFGIEGEVNIDKYKDPKFFKVVYNESDKVMIVKLKLDGSRY